MPEYIYRCDNGHEFTVIHPIGECNLARNCVECNSEMRRVPQAFRHYHPPGKLLLEKLNDAYGDMKVRNDKWRRRKQLGKIIS